MYSRRMWPRWRLEVPSLRRQVCDAPLVLKRRFQVFFTVSIWCLGRAAPEVTRALYCETSWLPALVLYASAACSERQQPSPARALVPYITLASASLARLLLPVAPRTVRTSLLQLSTRSRRKLFRDAQELDQ